MAAELGLGTVTKVITPDVQRKLYDETDARFATTGVTHRLDPNNALDQKWLPVWKKLYADVLAQYQAGTLAWTHDHPTIASALEAGSAAAKLAADHLTDLATQPKGAATTPGGAPAGSGMGMGQLSWASSPAATALDAGKAATDHAAVAIATVEANKPDASRGSRLGIAVAPPPALPDPNLVRVAAAEIGAMVRDYSTAALHVLNDGANGVAAIQAAGAPATADKAHQIATGGQAPPHDHHDGGKGMLPVAIGIAAAAGAIALIATAAGGGSRRRSSGSRRSQTLKIKLAR